VNSAAIPWDFVLILVVLGVAVPWRGAERVRRLMSLPDFDSAGRLSLYGTTIAFQWILALAVGWRAVARNLGLAELGLTVANPWRTVSVALALTGILCMGQVASLRRLLRLPPDERGALFRITEKIMPRTPPERLVFVALACTAGLSEEFLYRGFVFVVFARMLGNFCGSVAIAALISSIWFAVGHLYQGRQGVITTFIVSVIFMLARVFTGSLLPCMAAHAGVDLVAGLYVSVTLKQV
jgi:membrane protease YdiL (CAAX protease family)